MHLYTKTIIKRNIRLLPAVFLAEGLSQMIHLSEYMHMIPAVIGRIILGIALYFIIYRKAFYQRNSLISF